MRQRVTRQLLTSGLLGAALLGASGCLGFVHSLDAPPPEQVESCHLLPTCGRNHVYIFMLQGVDPFALSNLSGVRDYLHGLGFNKTYYGQIYHEPKFRDEIRRLSREDPEAHFVVLGFGMGANFASTLAGTLSGEGIPIDLLVYLEGTRLPDSSAGNPSSVVRVINVQTSNMLTATPPGNPDHLYLSGALPYSSPTNPETLQMLAKELTEVAARVPVPVRKPAPAPQWDETAPTPRRVQVPVQTSAQSDEWDFLKPASSQGRTVGLGRSSFELIR
jgi:hypothetical protein